MMQNKIIDTILQYDKLIISPDMDGFLSADFIIRENGSKVVGTYDKNILVLADGINPEDCLFVDCDMNKQKFASIGNHMRLLNDNMSDRSFNPNVFHGVTTYTDKFPFATAFLIAFALEMPLSQTDIIRMAYADSTLKNMEYYSDNMRNWSSRIPSVATDYIMENSVFAKMQDTTMREAYPSQSFSSKRYGKTRYIQALNDGLKAEGIDHLPLTTGTRYMADKVGKTTVSRYGHDILSYAEVYTGEYSVTYDQEIDWK